MKTRYAILAAVTGALIVVGAGCGAPAPSPRPQPPATNQAAEKPSSPGLPRETQQQLDEDDHLDAALKDLDTVE